MLKNLIVGMLVAGSCVSAQSPSRAKPSSPKSLRLYVFDCGMLTISTEGVTRYHVTPAEVGEARMFSALVSRALDPDHYWAVLRCGGRQAASRHSSHARRLHRGASLGIGRIYRDRERLTRDRRR